MGGATVLAAATLLAMALCGGAAARSAFTTSLDPKPYDLQVGLNTTDDTYTDHLSVKSDDDLSSNAIGPEGQLVDRADHVRRPGTRHMTH